MVEAKKGGGQVVNNKKVWCGWPGHKAAVQQNRTSKMREIPGALTETLEKKSRRMRCFAPDKKVGAKTQSLEIQAKNTSDPCDDWNAVEEGEIRGVVAV